jgi:hypothetical protein
MLKVGVRYIEYVTVGILKVKLGSRVTQLRTMIMAQRSGLRPRGNYRSMEFDHVMASLVLDLGPIIGLPGTLKVLSKQNATRRVRLADFEIRWGVKLTWSRKFNLSCIFPPVAPDALGF